MLQHISGSETPEASAAGPLAPRVTAGALIEPFSLKRAPGVYSLKNCLKSPAQRSSRF